MDRLSFTIYVTTKCNMNCNYCYEKKYLPADTHSAADMSLPIADRVIRFINHKIAEENARIVDVQFHGGEPLLNFPIIEHLISGLEKITEKGDLTFQYTMTTNATLFRKEMKTLLQKFAALSVSIDGDQAAHDDNRVFKNRKGTYHLVEKNIAEILNFFPQVSARVTLTPDTYQGVYHSFLHIIKLGVRKIFFELDYAENAWTEKMIEEYIDELKKIADAVYEKKIAGTNIEIPLLDSARTKRRNSVCSGGKTSFTITPEGDVYPCLVAISEHDFRLGEIGRPLNLEVVNKIEAVDKIKNPLCHECVRYDYCKGSRCKIVNYVYNNDFFTPNPLTCANEKIILAVGKYFLNLT